MLFDEFNHHNDYVNLYNHTLSLQVQFFKNDHYLTRVQRLNDYAFKPSHEDNVITVNIVWGLKHQDMGACDNSDFLCMGNTVWDTSFDLNPKRGQTALLVRY